MRFAKKPSTPEKKYYLSLSLKMMISAALVMATCFLFVNHLLSIHRSSTTDVQAFIDGRSDTFIGYEMGPVMQGVK